MNKKTLMKNIRMSLNWATMHDVVKKPDSEQSDDELSKEHAKYRAALKEAREEEEDNWTFVRDE